MNSLKSLIFPFAFAAALAASTLSSPAQSATATISGVQNGANYDYTITLHNTGSFALEDFWYGWIQFENDLPSDPSSAGNSLGWNSILDGNSIQYTYAGIGTPLAPGQTATFTFVDSSTPAQITAGISGESVAYVAGIDDSQGTPGDSTAIFSPTLVVPEPAAWALFLFGVVLVALKLRYSSSLRR